MPLKTLLQLIENKQITGFKNRDDIKRMINIIVDADPEWITLKSIKGVAYLSLDKGRSLGDVSEALRKFYM